MMTHVVKDYKTHSELTQLRKAITCNICLGLLDEPVSTSCSHIFCRKCIGNLLYYKDTCPVCTTRINSRKISPVCAFTSEIVGKVSNLICLIDGKSPSGTSSSKSSLSVAPSAVRSRLGAEAIHSSNIPPSADVSASKNNRRMTPASSHSSRTPRSDSAHGLGASTENGDYFVANSTAFDDGDANDGARDGAEENGGDDACGAPSVQVEDDDDKTTDSAGDRSNGEPTGGQHEEKVKQYGAYDEDEEEEWDDTVPVPTVPTSESAKIGGSGLLSAVDKSAGKDNKYSNNSSTSVRRRSRSSPNTRAADVMPPLPPPPLSMASMSGNTSTSAAPAPPPPPAATAATHASTHFGVGDVINVKSRNWIGANRPGDALMAYYVVGMNKPGGAARVLDFTVQEEEDTGRRVRYYDVKYVLDGTLEHEVNEMFVEAYQELARSSRRRSSTGGTEGQRQGQGLEQGHGLEQQASPPMSNKKIASMTKRRSSARDTTATTNTAVVGKKRSIRSTSKGRTADAGGMETASDDGGGGGDSDADSDGSVCCADEPAVAGTRASTRTATTPPKKQQRKSTTGPPPQQQQQPPQQRQRLGRKQSGKARALHLTENVSPDKENLGANKAADPTTGSAKTVTKANAVKASRGRKGVKSFAVVKHELDQGGASSAQTAATAVILCSGLTPALEAKVQSLVGKLPHVEVSPHFNASVTHLVVAADQHGVSKQRTMKYMQAVVAGLWVVSAEWVVESLQQRPVQLLPEEQFEVTSNVKATVDHAPRRARLAMAQLRMQQQQQSEQLALSQQNWGAGGKHRRQDLTAELFKGCLVFLAGQFPSPGPPRSDIEGLLRCGGVADIFTSDRKFLQAICNHVQARLEKRASRTGGGGGGGGGVEGCGDSTLDYFLSIEDAFGVGDAAVGKEGETMVIVGNDVLEAPPLTVAQIQTAVQADTGRDIIVICDAPATPCHPAGTTTTTAAAASKAVISRTFATAGSSKGGSGKGQQRGTGRDYLGPQYTIRDRESGALLAMVHVATTHWVLDSVTNFQLLPLE